MSGRMFVVVVVGDLLLVFVLLEFVVSCRLVKGGLIFVFWI